MRKVLIANRGEIAVRIAAACRASGIATVAVYSEADALSAHVAAADEAVAIGPAPAGESYLVVQKILDAAAKSGADAVHPGYGFLSENADFARAIQASGLTWVGPDPRAITAMGAKIGARERMQAAGVPVVPGIHDAGQDLGALEQAALRVGFPLLVKASAGGGGKGMRIVRAHGELRAALEAARREAESAFSDGALYVERLLERPRHIEIQIFGDSHGDVVHIGERECSIQRRHQKVLEEAPSVAVGASLRREMGEAAVRAAKAVDYAGAGTVEFMLDEDGSFYFLEMNTRLQVEHPVTEAVYGVDLVRAQLVVAAGGALPWPQSALTARGHAIEARLYAEDPQRGFLPSTGKLLRYRPPAGPGIRHDGGVREGDSVSVHYDPMLAKLIAWGEDRRAALGRLRDALRRWEIHGVTTNRDFLLAVATHEAFAAGETHTGFIGVHFPDGPAAVEVDDDVLTAVALADLFAGSDRGGGAPSVIREVAAPWHRVGPWRGAQ